MPFLIIGGLVLLLLALFAGVLYWVYCSAFRVSRAQKHPDPHVLFTGENTPMEKKQLLHRLIDQLMSMESERVTVKSRDGLTLSARYYPVSEDRTVAILFHGWRGTALRDGSGGADLEISMGHNLLIVDQRGHGESGGHTTMFGAMEKYDCAAWVNYINERFGGDVQIVLWGISMGAATVLMASDLELPNVRGIIADCGYSSPRAIIRKVARDRGLPAAPSWFLTKLAARLYGHFDVDCPGAVDAVKKTKLPILIIHGEADGFVPFEMSAEIRDACAGEVEYLAVAGADHGDSYVTDTETYVRTACAFEARILSDAKMTTGEPK